MLTVTKLDAATRNLTTAIRLFFDRGDPIAIHTLASAAQAVIRDLAKSKGSDKTSTLHDNSAIPDHIRKDWINSINAPRNFFKHADKDAKAKFDFHEEENELMLLDAVTIRLQLALDQPLEALAFIGWFAVAKSEMRHMFDPNYIADHCERNSISPTDFNRFKEFCDSRILIDEA